MIPWALDSFVACKAQNLLVVAKPASGYRGLSMTTIWWRVTMLSWREWHPRAEVAFATALCHMLQETPPLKSRTYRIGRHVSPPLA